MGEWLQLIVLGLLLYSVTQGAMFLGLFYLPAVTTSLLLSFTTIIVALLGLSLLKERPTWMQWGGTALYLVGVLVYFFPMQIPAGEFIGLIVAGACVLGNALSTILGRHINRGGRLDPMTVTVVSMGIGSVVLLASGIAVQGLPRLTLTHWVIIAWLAAVNSALAYTLWNHTLRTLAAVESSTINNTMLFQITLLAWVFLGEQLTWQRVIGMGDIPPSWYSGYRYHPTQRGPLPHATDERPGRSDATPGYLQTERCSLPRPGDRRTDHADSTRCHKRSGDF